MLNWNSLFEAEWLVALALILVPFVLFGLFEASVYWRRRKAAALATRSKSVDGSSRRRRR